MVRVRLGVRVRVRVRVRVSVRVSRRTGVGPRHLEDADDAQQLEQLEDRVAFVLAAATHRPGVVVGEVERRDDLPTVRVRGTDQG